MHQRRFISLKWKALLILTLVMALTVAVVSWFAYRNLLDQFEERLAADHASYREVVQALTSQTAQHLTNLGELIPYPGNMQAALGSGDPDRIAVELERHMPMLDFSTGITTVRFFDLDNHLVAQLDSPMADELPGNYPQRWIRQVNESEQPFDTIFCHTACIQVVVTPVLAEGRHTGTLLIATSLAQLILDINAVTGHEVGIVTPKPTGHADEMDFGLAALTGDSDYRRMFKEAMQAHPGILDDLEGSKRISHGGRHLDLWRYPLRQPPDGDTPSILIVADITGTMQAILAATRNTLFTALGGFSVSILILAIILGAPMRRLQQIASILPWLAHKQYARVRQLINRSMRQRRSQDEIDILGEATITLSDQLEGLEIQLNRRTHDLEDERDFLRNLVNAAQVIVCTLDRNGCIRSVNPLGEKIIGEKSHRLAGRPFSDLLLPIEWNEPYPSTLQRLIDGDTRHMRHEGTLVAANGAVYHVDWSHARLERNGQDGPRVLTVGLDITARREAESRTDWLSNHDPLTELYNRRRFLEAVESHLSGTESGALLHLDVDDFRLLNDTGGHHLGDAVIKSLANQVQQLLSEQVGRKYTTMGRIGGDEFGIVLQDVSSQDALRIARQLSRHISGLDFPLGDNTHRLSACIGVAAYPQHGKDAHSLLAHADIAVKFAKSKGKGRCELYSPESRLRERMREQVRWRTSIHEALRERRLELHYQPIQHIANGAISHYEALVRIRDREGKLIPPETFVQVAETSGQIGDLDRAVVGMATDCIQKLGKAGREVNIAVNLSGKTLGDMEFADFLAGRLQQTDLPSEKLIFEITETAAMTDLASARRFMERVREYGCRFALDDFGAGFTSFFYLQELPLDLVKIDGAFIKDLGNQPGNQVLVQAFADIAHGFGMKTVAEFVDSDATYELLREYGIDYAQGYHIGAPAILGQ